MTAISLICAAFSGCASTPGVVFNPANGASVWPPPPDVPRIRYVGQLHSDEDLRASRSGMQQIGDALFGKSPSQGVMVNPVAVCTDGGQKVFVADSSVQAVHVFDLNTREYKRWTPTKEYGRFVQPVAVAYHPSGRLLVSDSLVGHVFVFDAAGTCVGTIGKGALQRPCGIAVDAENKRILVVDTGAHQVVVFGEDGVELSRIGERGTGLGQFNFPTNLAIDRSGRLYVSDSLNFRVQLFGADLRPIRQIGRKGDMPGYFAQPKGVSLDSEDHVYVMDSHFEAVQLFDQDGVLLMTFGHEGHGPGEFWLPGGIFVDPSNRIWIADAFNSRVQVFDYMPEGGRP